MIHFVQQSFFGSFLYVRLWTEARYRIMNPIKSWCWGKEVTVVGETGVMLLLRAEG